VTEGIFAVLYVSVMGLTRCYKTTVYFTFIATHAHTIATCFAAVPRLFLVFQLVTWNSILYFNITHTSI